MYPNFLRECTVFKNYYHFVKIESIFLILRGVLFCREGYLCIWKCSVESDDFVVNESPLKKSKLMDSGRGEEEDVHLEKGLESTTRNKETTELSLTKLGMLNKSFVNTIKHLILHSIISIMY